MGEEEGEEEGEEAYGGASEEEVEFALQQVRPPVAHAPAPLRLTVPPLARAQALALNEQLRRMELEVQQQQLQQQTSVLREQRNMPPGRRQQQPGGGSAAAAAARASKGGWGGTTHTVDRARAIDRENAHLVKQLTQIATGHRGPASTHIGGRGGAPPPAAPRPRASASINRQRKNDQIAQENARLAKRLAGAKAAVATHKPHEACRRSGSRPVARCRRQTPAPPPPPSLARLLWSSPASLSLRLCSPRPLASPRGCRRQWGGAAAPWAAWGAWAPPPPWRPAARRRTRSTRR